MKIEDVMRAIRLISESIVIEKCILTTKAVIPLGLQQDLYKSWSGLKIIRDILRDIEADVSPQDNAGTRKD